ncbi:hypothetical protein [Paenibacillus radicis (ex Xue et al. 2023)]|uniref:Uncharacterized protein n=1 Tax=Paenibacillus radicis (ex Xue et al. 2023) TaxID=2972489 RepID=A0ABT1YJZ2_9BACL|nr:hypothetical protein [Paenibacillus radicis (ex Xue et al. 2023)]MCR8633512.1 hypothetical protein [Paenibacillus radicis (ex Xue et al. 2023)]
MKKTVISGILSFIHPGLGQIYNDDIIKGIIFIIIVFIGTVIEVCILPALLVLQSLYVIFAIIDILFWVVCIIEAILKAIKNNKTIIEPRAHLNIYVKVIYITLIVTIVPVNFIVHFLLNFLLVPIIMEDAGWINIGIMGYLGG